MKAFVYKRYGPPQVLRMEDRDKPGPKGTELLVKVEALSINPAEWHLLTASVWLVRLSGGLFRPQSPILGADIAGTVVEIGEKVKGVQKGDKVFGRCLSGGLSEYACLDVDSFEKIPDGISFQEGAALPLAAVTALIALRDKGQIKPGQKILINGASGGIGTFAVQLAKHFEAHVTAVCSTDNTVLVRQIGSDQVIDYKKQTLESVTARFDLIVDLVGNKKLSALTNLLKPNGRCVLVGMDTPGRLLGNVFRGLIFSSLQSKKVVTMDAEVSREDLSFIAQLVSEGKIHPVIDSVYDFASVQDAFARQGSRRSKGKIVVNL